MSTASGSNTGGFSYAQAARGRQPAAPTVTGAPANPALTTPAAQPSSTQPSTLSNLASTKNWAEDVEASVGSKRQETSEEAQDTGKQSEKSILERTKLDSKLPSSSSGVSSPDIAASATSHDDVSSSAQNGSSLSSWEAKSQSSDTVVPSEPAWIVERKERQNTNKVDTPLKGGNTNLMPEHKATVLHEAPLPTVNPWAKRAESAKAKAVVPTVKPATTPAVRNALKENAKPKTNSEQAHPVQSSHKVETTTNARPQGPPQTARPRKTDSKVAVAQPPSVKDEIAWPTPETSQETERKSSTSQQLPDGKQEDEGVTKPRKKQEWKNMLVTPNVIFETQGIRERNSRQSPTAERAPRGGASARGRGGGRGAASNTHSDRAASNPEVSTVLNAAQSTSTDLSRPSVEDNARSKPRETNGELPNGSTDVQDIAGSTPSSTSESVVNGVNGAHPRTAPVEFIPLDTRKETRNGEPARESYTNRGNARRNGRGRGGNRDIAAYTHMTQNQYNAYAADFAQYAQQIASHSGGRAGNQSPYNAFGRAGQRTGRTQSYPEVHRYPPHFLGHHQFPLYAQGFQDFGMYQMPMAAPGQPDPMQIASTVTAQIDYYFSVDNLLSDTYLRKNMDSQGFVLLEVIATFNRMKILTTSMDMLKFACANSEVVELVSGDDGKDRVRKVTDWQTYVLAMEERLAAARNDGPKHIEHIGRVNNLFQLRQQMPSPYSMGPRAGDRRSYDFSYAMGNQMSPQAMFSPEYPTTYQRHEQNGGNDRSGPASIQENGNGTGYPSPAPQTDEDKDVFPDDKLEQLSVCVKLSKETAPQYNASSRTFSNGSIDAQVVDSDNKSTNGDKSSQSGVGTPSAESKAQNLSVFWIKDTDQPVEALPMNLTPEPYMQLRMKALEQRSRAAPGSCPYDLDVLYQFWSHFLIRNFNNAMYGEFIQFARQDAQARYSKIGMRNLVKFYDETIKSTTTIPLRVAKDYVALAVSERLNDDSEVLKNLRRAWRDGALNLRNRKRVSDLLDEESRQVLEG